MPTGQSGGIYPYLQLLFKRFEEYFTNYY